MLANQQDLQSKLPSPDYKLDVMPSPSRNMHAILSWVVDAKHNHPMTPFGNGNTNDQAHESKNNTQVGLFKNLVLSTTVKMGGMTPSPRNLQSTLHARMVLGAQNHFVCSPLLSRITKVSRIQTTTANLLLRPPVLLPSRLPLLAFPPMLTTSQSPPPWLMTPKRHHPKITGTPHTSQSSRQRSRP